GSRADGGELAGILLDVAQPVDAVTHHEAHGSGIVVGPDGFRPVFGLDGPEALRHRVERLVPGDAGELAGPPRAGALEGIEQPVRMVDALGVAGDLGADDASRVAVVAGTVDAADSLVVDHLHVERTGGGTVVRA